MFARVVQKEIIRALLATKGRNLPGWRRRWHRL